MGRLPNGCTRRKDGRLEYRFTLAGRRRSVYGHTAEECLAKADALRLDASQRATGGSVTVREYFYTWLNGRAHTIRESTNRGYRERWKRVDAYIGDKRICDLTRRDILHAQAAMRARYGTASVNMSVKIIRAICRSAVMDGLIDSDPSVGVSGLKRTEPKATATIHRALTLEEQNTFMRTAKAFSYFYPLYALMLQTGMRCGEALALSWRDIDTDKRLIHVTKTVTRNLDGKFVIGSAPKTESSNRDIPLTPPMEATLAEQRRIMAEAHGIDAVRDDRRIFLGKLKPGIVIPPAEIYANVRLMTKKAGMRRISTHTLRDTFATRAIEQGMPPNTLKEILGHSSIAMTMDLYAQVMDDEKRRAMESIRIVV